jgi:hypothetical protein
MAVLPNVPRSKPRERRNDRTNVFLGVHSLHQRHVSGKEGERIELRFSSVDPDQENTQWTGF